MTIAECNEHIQLLLHTFCIRLVHCKAHNKQWSIRYFVPDKDKGFIGEVGLHAMPFKKQADYAIALHEIGHVVDFNQEALLAQDKLAQRLCDREMLSKGYMRNEIRAWIWAKEDALLWTRAMENERQNALLSYATVDEWKAFGLSSRRGKLLIDKWEDNNS